MPNLKLTRPLGWALILTALNISAAAHGSCGDELLKRRIRIEMAARGHDDLGLTFVDPYYSLGGGRGLVHERSIAEAYARWLAKHEDRRLLFMPRFAGVDTPGVDALVFDGDATRPEKRVSFKSVQSIATTQTEIVKNWLNQAQRAAKALRRFETLESVYPTVFPPFRPDDLRRWIDNPPTTFFDKIRLLSAMGLERALPTVVVIGLTGPCPGEWIEEFKCRLRGSPRTKPAEILFTGSQCETVHLLESEDY